MSSTATELRAEVEAELHAEYGPTLRPWQNALLDIDPSLLRRMKAYRDSFFHLGPLPERMLHLIFAGASAVGTHMVPIVIRAHAATAIQLGASVEQVVETLTIAAVVSSRGNGFGIPLVLEELDAAGLPASADLDQAHVAEVRARIEVAIGELPEWMNAEMRIDPDSLEAFVSFSAGPSSGETFSPKDRELMFVAMASCPMIVDADLTRYHIRRAIGAGASREELIHAVRAGNSVGLHTVFFGVEELQNYLDSTK